MGTRISLDQALVRELMKYSDHSTKTAAVTEAVKEQLRRAKLKKLASLFGKIPFDETALEQTRALDKEREDFLAAIQ